MMTRRIVWLVLSLIFYLPGFAADGQTAYRPYADRVVVIEYYEVASTFHSIQNKERTKKFLTGVVVGDSGLVMTSASIFKARLEMGGGPAAFHGAQKPTDIRVRLADGSYVPATFVGKDDDLGLAFVRMKSGTNVKPVHFSDTGALVRGQRIWTLHRLPESFDFELVVSEKIINTVLKEENARYLCEANPLVTHPFGLALDAGGRPVGVVNSAPSANGMGALFARTSRYIYWVVTPFKEFKQLIAHPPVYRQKQTARKHWLGVYMQPFTEEMAGYFGADSVQGVLINTILEGSPAQKAGLKIGDVVTAVNGIPVPARTDNDLQLFRKLIRQARQEQVTLTVFRNHKIATMRVTLGEIPFSQFLAEEASDELLGFSVKELTRDIILAKHLEYDTEGVWVSRVERAGWADLAGLQIGDLILAVNEVKINSLDDMRQVFKSINEKQPEYVALFIKRGAETRFLFIRTDYSQS